MANNFSFNEYLVIDTTGSVGIGSTNPIARLYVTGSSTTTSQTTAIFRPGTANQLGGAAVLDVQNSSGTSILFVSGSGNVGIGTATVRAQTHIYGNGQTTTLTDAGNRGAMLRLSTSDTVLGSGGGLLFANSQGDTQNSLGYAAIKGYLYDGSGNTAGDLTFFTRNATSDTSLTERVRITYGGLVGIGTTSPSTRLHVNNTGTEQFWIAGGGSGYLFAGYDQTNSRGRIGAYTGSAYTTLLLNEGGGSVGIGTTSPAARFHAHSGAADEVARFESTGNPYISLYDSGTRQGYFYSNTSSVELVAENSKPLYLQGATEIRLRTNTSTDRVIINSGGVVGINNTPPVTTTASKLIVEGDITLAQANKSLLGNLYYDTAVPGFKYSGNGYGWGFREDNAGKLQMVRAGNNSSGANASASVSLADLFTFDLVNNRVGLGTDSPQTKFHVLHTTNDPVIIEQTTDTAWNRIYFKKPTRNWTLGPDNGTGSNNIFVLADETAGAYRVAVDTSGNVGINTSSGLTKKLVVYGSDALINDLTVGRGGVASNVGSSNTALGYAAGAALTVGYSYNTAIGGSALTTNAAGERNTALGNSSLLNYNPTASTGDSTAVGYASLYSSTTGVANTAVGSYSLYSATTTSYNTAVGVEAMRNGIVMDRSVAVGYRAMYVAGGDDDNVAVGYQSAYSLDKGDRCTAIGSISLFNMKDNTDSTAVGYASLYANTGSYNTSIGSYSLVSNTTGTGNVAVGYAAGLLNSTATGNVAIGYQALYSNTTASGSVGIGYESLYSTTGADNTAIGWWAGRSVSTGTNNVAVGSNALRSATTTSSNVAVGFKSLELSTGTSNTALGTAAGSKLTTGGSNVAIGALSLFASSGISGSTAVGTGALVAATGDGNTAVGFVAGSAITSGTGNVLVGSYSGNSGGLDIRTSNNNIVLSDGQGTVRMHIDNTGAVGIGTTTAFGGYMLHLYSGSNNSTNMLLQSDVDMSTGIYLQAGAGVGHFYRPTGSGNYRLGTTSSTALDIQTGGTTAINIDTSQNVGVGTASTGGDSIRSYRSSGNTVSIYSNTSNASLGLTGYVSTTAVTAAIECSSTDVNVGSVTSHPIRLLTNAVERVRIDTSGNVGIGTSTTDATLRVARGSATNGTAMLLGTTNHTHFNYSTAEDTYIRGGKSGSVVYVNDGTIGNVVVTTAGTNYVGVGTTQPTLNSGSDTAKLTVQTASDSALATTAIRMHNPGGFGATRIEWVSDPAGSDWRPGFIQSGDAGSYTGRLIFYTNGTGSGNKWSSTLGMIVTNGSVGIGTLTPGKTLHVYGGMRNTNRNAASTQTALHINTTTGDIAETASSRRFKRNIADYTKGLETLVQLRAVSFQFLADDLPNTGLIAEEVHELGLPEFIRYDADDKPYSIPYDNLSALFVNSIKDLKTENDSLKSEIQSLKDQISSILAIISNK